MAFCVNCGNQMQDGMKFCPACGTPVMPVRPQYTAPVQPNVPQYTAPMPPVQEYVQPEPVQQQMYTPPMQQYVQPEPKYEETEYDEPEPEPEQEYTPPSRPKAIYAKYEESGDPDADLDMDSAEPIVGSYVIPTQAAPDTTAGKGKAAGKSKAPAAKKVKQSSGSGSRLPMIIGIAAGAIVAIVVIAVVISKIAGSAGGTNVKGKGTALGELIEMAADKSSSGGGDTFTVDDGESNDDYNDESSEAGD